MSVPKQITIRNPSPELARRIKAIADAEGESMNTTILRLLENAVGLEARYETLKKYATWTRADLEEFELALAAQRQIDGELWE